jgi:hypothetical protein
MGLISLTLPTIGQPNATEDADVLSCLTALQTAINGALDQPNLTTALLQQLGLNSGSQVGRGKSIIATTESRTNVAYGTLTTPDQVTGIVLPTDGLICVAYQATWQESVNAAARAAIFIGANQVKYAQTQNAGPIVQEAFLSCGTPAIDKGLASAFMGLESSSGTIDATAYTGDVTTGQILGYGSPALSAGITPEGGPCYVFAAAGTYTVSVQFKASSGSVTAKNRKLLVWTIGF